MKDNSKKPAETEKDAQTKNTTSSPPEPQPPSPPSTPPENADEDIRPGGDNEERPMGRE